MNKLGTIQLFLSSKLKKMAYSSLLISWMDTWLGISNKFEI